ncbi:MAG: L-seryl-tRNA(Sec) selenium transferase [Desulfobacteraceae bacterium 4572_35.1]|nr:MAG: L-seryl-tRNA(Sec) selenium transferase [Desulfobacteraceae bacterium 4572_35.1]
MVETSELLKQLPSIDKVLNHPLLAKTAAPHCLVVEAAQEAVDLWRQQILRHETGQLPAINLAAISSCAINFLQQKQQPSLRRIINATGTLLHTNLGRAPLSEAAIQAIDEAARGYSNLELDLTSGKRGHRYSHVDELLCRLTGAEAAAVVNNNAGAVLLALAALARGKEAVVSRGELVEIGGAFRVPDVMEAGGVILREVGTTNKTHLRDYQQALNDNTGLLLKVHTSNYRIIGFSESVTAAQMVELGREHKIPVMEDLGSGMLFDLSPFGLPKEPTVKEGVDAGIDILTFSGDKLLGGPQAGIIVGKKWAVDKIRHHPLARALRIDKLTLAALETTLRHYLDQQQAIVEIPLLRMLNMGSAELEQRTITFMQELKTQLDDGCELKMIRENSCVGGGALPTTDLPGVALSLKATNISAEKLAAKLRKGEHPVVARIQDNQLVINLRTIFPYQEKIVAHSLQQIISSDKQAPRDK